MSDTSAPDSPTADKDGVASPSAEEKADSQATLPKKLTLGARLRAYFLTGILVTAPIAITIYLAYLLISFVDETITPLIPAKYNPETYLPFGIPGMGLVLVVVTLTLIGAFTAGFIGRIWMRVSEAVVDKVPVIRGIYSATKQILETVLAQKSQAFRQAVLVEYPRRGLWTIAFVTGATEGEIGTLAEPDSVTIYVPTTPNPTSGFLLFVPRQDLRPLSMSVEDAFKLLISGGIVSPDSKKSRSTNSNQPEN